MELWGNSVLLISYRMVGRWKRKKNVQFVTLWHLLKHGRLMTNFQEFKQLFQFLKVENYLQKH